MRQPLAAKAFAHTAQYDAMVSAYFTGAIGGDAPTFPDDLQSVVPQAPGSALRRESAPAGRLLHRSARHRRLGDGRARRCRARSCRTTTSPTPIPRSNACASSRRPPASSSSTPIPAASPSAAGIAQAYEHAYRTDPTSAFGGIIAFNRQLDAATARAHPRAAVRRGHPGAGRERTRRVPCWPPRTTCACSLSGDLGEPGGAAARVQERHRRPAGADARRGAHPRRTDLRAGHAAAQPSAAELEDLLFAWRVAKYRQVQCDRLRQGPGAPSASAPAR